MSEDTAKHYAYFSVMNLDQGVISSSEPFALVTANSNTWNDFTWRLHVDVWLVHNGKSSQIGTGKLLIDGVRDTDHKITEILANDSFKPFIEALGDTAHLFTLRSKENYRLLIDTVGIDFAKKILLSLNDVGALRLLAPHSEDLEKLRRTEGYRKALFREDETFNASISLEDLFRQREPFINSDPLLDVVHLEMGADYDLPYGGTLFMQFSFPHTPFGTSRINVLIGDNGIGKTEILRSTVTKIMANEFEFDGSAIRPAVSDPDYEPYFFDSRMFDRVLFIPSGVDDPRALPDVDDDGRIKLLPPPASSTAWHSVTTNFLGILRGRSESHTTESNLDILMRAIERYLDISELYLPVVLGEHSRFPKVVTSDGSYAKLLGVRLNEERMVDLLNAVDESRPPKFFVMNELGAHVERRLSSGQKTFFTLAVSLIRYVSIGSIVILDEPELSMHPHMIAALMNLIDEILELKSSFALIATHSIYLVREVQRECVHVIKRMDNDIVSDLAPFMQTFGADLSILSSAIFSEGEIKELYEKKVEQITLTRRGESVESMRQELRGYLGAEAVSKLKEEIAERSNEEN